MQDKLEIKDSRLFNIKFLNSYFILIFQTLTLNRLINVLGILNLKDLLLSVKLLCFRLYYIYIFLKL
jgi:hypothetical protein